eukprot:jgi/Hompol1/4987/HPOL_004072-RA
MASSRTGSSEQTTKLYGDTALKLVKEAIRTRDSPSLAAFQDDIVRDTILEIKHLSLQLDSFHTTLKQLAARYPDGSIDGEEIAAAARAPIETAQAMHLLALQRNKRCVLAYQRHRLDRIIQTLWESGSGASTASSLPQETMQQMSLHENGFVAGYKALASRLRGQFLDINLGAALVPPKDVFVEIRVTRDCGEIMTEGGPLQLAAGTQHYLRRVDVEDLILSGDVVQVG